jgi:hypothetical protein
VMSVSVSMSLIGAITPSRARISAIGREREVDGSLDDMGNSAAVWNKLSAVKSGLTRQDELLYFIIINMLRK